VVKTLYLTVRLFTTYATIPLRFDTDPKPLNIF